MGQTHEGAMKVSARRAGISVDDLRKRQEAGQKLCYICRKWLSVDEFVKDRSRHDGLATACSPCRSSRTAPGPTNTERKKKASQGLKWCNGCAAWLASDSVKGGKCRKHHAEYEKNRYASDQKYQLSRRHRSAQRRRNVAVVPLIGKETLTETFGGKCAFCDSVATTFDHLTPVSRGGLTSPRNIVPACVSCNSSKKSKDLYEWLMTSGRIVKSELIDIIVMEDSWVDLTH